MPRRALRCVVDLNIFRLSAPGVWLPSREDVYISISIFGQYRCTRNATSVFPLLFHQPFRFEKTYYTALDPSDVAEFLEDELVVIELLQYSDYSDGAIRLASFSCSAREFLYPYPTLCPSYASSSRELLMSRTIAFPGISPKMEFSTKTVIKESRSPELDALEDALEEEKLTRRSRSRSRSRGRSRSVSRTRSLSRTRSCSIDDGYTLYRSYSSESDDSIDSDPSYMRPTISSIFRSRSKSALDSSLIGRTPGAPALKGSSGKKKKRSTSRSRPSSALGNYSSISSAKCPTCSAIHKVYTSERDCVVCRAYTRYMGRPYWGHSDNFHPTGQPCCPQVIRDDGGSLPVYTTRYTSDSESDDAEVAALTSSRPLYVTPRPRSTSPYLYKSPYSARLVRTPSPILSAADRVDLAIERAKIRARARALSRSPSPVLYRSYTPILRDTMDDLAINTSIAKNRSMVHLDAGQYWTERAAQLSGKSNRQVFEDNMGKIYKGIYRNISQSKRK